MSQLKVFDQLVSDITLLVTPTKSLKVSDPESSQAAIEAAKNIKGYISRVEDKRKELVGPLNEQVKAINNYCKQITAPLTDADNFVRAQLNEFAAAQEKIRRAEEMRIEADRQKAERLAQIERQRIEEALRAKMNQDAETHAKSANLFGIDHGDMEQANSEIVSQQDREWADKQAELDLQAAARADEFKKRQWDADQNQIKNTRATLKVRIVDVNSIPKEFLIITPNERALLAAGKAGVKIAGVEFWEDIQVAIGRTTRMPSIADAQYLKKQGGT